MEEIKISSPWVTYVHKLQCLFGDDPDIKIDYSDETTTVKILVKSVDKTIALTNLLKPKVQFGNVTLNVQVIPSNEGKSYAAMVRDVFLGNPHFYEFVTIDLQTNPVHYAIFNKEVAQFFNDNLADAHGNISTLYEDLAREIIGQEGGVHFCTDNECLIGKPLGEWP